MCLCHPEFQAANERGYLLDAVRLAEAPCPKERCSSAKKAEWLGQFARRFPFKRDLRGQHPLKIAVYGWFAQAREEIPDAVERFWRPDGEVGVARFCAVRPETGLGHVCALRAHEQKSDVPLRADKVFLGAIDWAQRFVVTHLCAGVAAERVLRATVSVEPCDEEFQDASVALAALVAFASLALRLPVQPDLVFTGIPGAGGHDVDVPAADTLRAKLEAVRASGERTRMVAPLGSRARIGPIEAISSLIEDNWQGALCLALGRDDFETLRAEASRYGASTALRASASPAILQEFVGACLAAAGSQGTSLYELERCLSVWLQHDDRLREVTGRAIETELRQLERIGVVALEGERWALLHPGTPPTPRSLELAHLSLADVHLSRGSLEQALGSLLWLQQIDRAAQAIDARVAGSFTESEETRRHAWVAKLQAFVREQPERLPRVLQMLERSQRLGGALPRVVLQAEALGPPFAALAAAWAGCTAAVDRLLWLQAVTELALHLLVILGAQRTAALSAAPLAPKLQEHARRPALGTMAELIPLLCPGLPAPFDTQQSANKLISPWNKRLHRMGAWRELAEASAGDLDTSTEQLAATTLRVLDCLQQLGGPQQALHAPHGTTGAADPELLVHSGGTWLVRRGVLDHQVRYWTFDQPRCLMRPPSAPLSALVSFSPAASPSPLPPLARQNLPLDRLPTPLALALRVLRPDGLAPVLRLAALDEATHWLLRLAIPDAQTAHSAAARAGWAQGRHKRSLLEAIQHDTSADARLGAYLRTEPARRHAFELIGTLERLEHAPGPTSAWGPWLDAATRLLGALIGQSPWRQGDALLFGLVGDAPWTFIGLHPRTAKGDVARPPSASAGASWISWSGSLIPCVGWSRLADGAPEPALSLHR